jgi:glutamine amidotransferase
VFKAFARALRMAVARDPRAGASFLDQGRACSRIASRRSDEHRVIDTAWATCVSVAKALAQVAPEREVVVSADRRRSCRRARGAARPERDAGCMRGLIESGLANVAWRACATARSSASASACRCCSTTARRARRRARRDSPGAWCAFATRRWSRRRRAPQGPHMGWSRVRQRAAHPLWAGIEDGERFYFAHSYHPGARRPGCHGGDGGLSGAVYLRHARANIFARQFHPEKSHRAGLRSSPIRPPGTAALTASARPPLRTAPRSPRRLRHADHPRDRHQGRHCVRLKQGDMQSATVFSGGPAGDGPALAGAGRAAAASGRPQRLRWPASRATSSRSARS